MGKRKQSQLRVHDHSSPDAYFVTMCTHKKIHLFGSVCNSTAYLHGPGKILQDQSLRKQHIRNDIRIDSFVIMPNHAHIILFIEPVGATRRVAPTSKSSTLQPNSLSALIGQIKSNSTKGIRQLPGLQNLTIWQRNYFDHIIRNENSLNHHRQYMLDNPHRWDESRQARID